MIKYTLIDNDTSILREIIYIIYKLTKLIVFGSSLLSFLLTNSFLTYLSIINLSLSALNIYIKFVANHIIILLRSSIKPSYGEIRGGILL